MWQKGRQSSGYQKLTLWDSYPKWDLYILRMKPEGYVPWHRDKLKNTELKHYRCNFIIKHAKVGGRFIMDGNPLFKFWRLVVFRPDIVQHRVSKVEKGTRYILSLGFTKK